MLHTSTGLHETGSRFTFCVGDYNGDGTPDLYAIKKSGTSSKKTEVHILNGADKYKKFALQTGTCLETVGKNFTFCVADYNRNGNMDVYAVKKKATGTRKTEVHIFE